MADNPLTKLPLAGQLGVSAVIAALICGGFYYFWYSDALETAATEGSPARRPAEADPGARGHREPAAGVPARGAGARGAPRDAEAHPAAGEGDARPDAAHPVPRRAVEPPDPEVQPGRRRPEGLLPGGPGQPRPRGHLPQHGRLPRPREPDVPAREHGRPQDQGADQRRRSTTRSRSRRRPPPTSTWTRPPPARRRPARSGRDPGGAR